MALYGPDSGPGVDFERRFPIPIYEVHRYVRKRPNLWMCEWVSEHATVEEARQARRRLGAFGQIGADPTFLTPAAKWPAIGARLRPPQALSAALRAMTIGFDVVATARKRGFGAVECPDRQLSQPIYRLFATAEVPANLLQRWPMGRGSSIGTTRDRYFASGSSDVGSPPDRPDR